MAEFDDVLNNLPDKSPTDDPLVQSTLDNLPDQRPQTDDERFGSIRQAPEQTWWERARDFVNDTAAAFPMGGPEKGREKRLAKSGAVLSIVDQYAARGIPVTTAEVERDFDKFTGGKQVRPGVQGLGLRAGLSYDEAVELGMGAMVGAGLATAPIATATGLAGFEALGYLKSNALEMGRTAYLDSLDLLGVGGSADPLANRRTHEPGTFRDLRDFLPEDSSTPLKALFDAAEFAALGKTLHVASGPARVAAKHAFEVATHKIITDIRAPESVFIAPEKVKSIFGSGEKITAEEADMVSALGLTAKQYRTAMDYGLNIEIPTAKLVTLTERPWWGKVRQLFGLSPYEAYTREVPMGEARGSVPVPALPEGTGAAPVGGVAPRAPEISPEAMSAQAADAIANTPLYPEPAVDLAPASAGVLPDGQGAAAARIEGGSVTATIDVTPDMAYLSMQNEAQARALEGIAKKREAEMAKATYDARRRFKEAEAMNPIASISKVQVNYDSALAFFGKQGIEGIPVGRLSKRSGSVVDVIAQEYGVSTDQVLEGLRYSSKRAESEHLEAFKSRRSAVEAQPDLPFDDIGADSLRGFISTVDRFNGLNEAFVTANYPPEIVAVLRAGNMLRPGGVMPEVVMRDMGYADETAMLQELGLALNGRVTAEQSMRAQLEMSNSVAQYSLDSSEYALFLEEQAKILERLLNGPRTKATPKILDAGPDTVAEIMVDERAALEAALKRAEKASRDAFRAGDMEGALQQKEHQKAIVERARARRTQRQEIAKIKKQLEDAAGNKKIPLEYQDQIAAIMDGVDVRRSAKTQRRLDSLGDFLMRQEAEGEDISGIPQDIIDRLGKRPLTTFTMDELRDLRDSVQMLEHLGGLKGKLIASKQSRDFNAVVLDVVSGIYEKAKVDAAALRAETDATRFINERPSLFGRISKGIDDGFAKIMMPQMIVRALDGFASDGPAHEAIWWAQKHASDAELIRIEQHHAAMERILVPVMEEGKDFFNKRYTIEGVRGLLTKNTAVSIALNAKRPVNIRHMVNGNKISPAEIKLIADSLEPKYQQMVEQIWDYTESLFKDIEANNVALTGKRLVKTEGRYYPAAIDWQKARKGDAVLESMAQGNAFAGDFYTRPGTRASFRQQAVGGNQPLVLDLNVWVRHLMSEAKDTTRTLAARDTSKLLLHPAVKQAIIDTRGEGEYRALITWLKRQRDVNPTPMDTFGQFLEGLRGNMTVSQLALNWGNILVQPTSYLNVFAENKISTAEIAKTFAEYVASPQEMTQRVLSLSVAMRDRVGYDTMGFDREVAELANAVGRINASDVKKFQRVVMTLTVAMDRVASIPAWHVVYANEFAKHGDQAKAIDFADASVARTQSTSSNLEKPELLANKNAAVRTLTMFATWVNAVTNTAKEQVARTMREPTAENIGGLLRYAFWAIVVQQALTAPVKYGRLPDKKEVVRDIVGAPFAGIPIVSPLFINPLLRVSIGSSVMPPVVSPLERIPQVSVDIASSMATNTPEARMRAMTSALELGGMVSGIPTRPITNVVKARQEKRRSGKGNALNMLFPRQRETKK